MTVMTQAIDWPSWLERWDRQQAGHFPNREARFTAMLDVLDVLFAGNCTVLDLASGPGSISQRVLTRFPDAQSIAVDLDPVLLAIGEGALGTMAGRLRWITADLQHDDWAALLAGIHIDAVLTTTALHWLPPEALLRVNRTLGALLPEGGVFLNGDHFAFPPHLPTFSRVAQAIRERNRVAVAAREDAEDWQQWWQVLAQEPGLTDLVAERERRFVWRTRTWAVPGYALHEAALREAGFREVSTIWQTRDNRVLMAVR